MILLTRMIQECNEPDGSKHAEADFDTSTNTRHTPSYAHLRNEASLLTRYMS